MQKLVRCHCGCGREITEREDWRLRANGAVHTSLVDYYLSVTEYEPRKYREKRKANGEFKRR